MSTRAHPGWIYEGKAPGGGSSATRTAPTSGYSAVPASVAALPIPTLVLDGEVARLRALHGNRFADIGCRLREHVGAGVVSPPPCFSAHQEPVLECDGFLSGAAELASAGEKVTASNGIGQTLRR